VRARAILAALAGAACLASSATVRAAPPAENHILVGGAVGFAFTRTTSICVTKGGKLVSFGIPDDLRDPESSPPDVTGLWQDGAWDVETHSPDRRFFKTDNAAGVVVKQEAGGTWRIELHNIKMEEELTMKIDYASVSGIITCTTVQALPE
jgi:hypothetical protein